MAQTLPTFRGIQIAPDCWGGQESMDVIADFFAFPVGAEDMVL